MYKGQVVVGQMFRWEVVFHNDANTPVDPTGPAARQRTPAGVWSNLAAPTKQDGKTGLYGGTIDTTAFALGNYSIHVWGTVSGHVVGTVLSFDVVDTGVNVKTIVADAIKAATIETDAIGSDKLAASAVTKIVTAILASVVDGTIDVKTALKVAHAFAKNIINKSGDTYTYRNNADDADLWTSTLTDNKREPS